MTTKNYKKYLGLAQKMHMRESAWDGHSLVPHISAINSIIAEQKIKTALDYGCGKAKFHPAEWSSLFTKYDPGYPLYDKEPVGKYDLVICTDVMEHIPEDSVEYVIERLFSFARKHVYVNVCTRPAGKKLANGENAHVTVKPQKWWDAVFEKISSNYPDITKTVIYEDITNV